MSKLKTIRGGVTRLATLLAIFLMFSATVTAAQTVDAGGDRIVGEGDTVRLLATSRGFSRPSYLWGEVSGGVRLRPADNVINPTFTAPTQLVSDVDLMFGVFVAEGNLLLPGLFARDTVTITVTAGQNDAPTANAGVDKIVTEGSPVTLDGRDSTDPEREDLTYAWAQTRGTTVTLDGADTVAPRFTMPSGLTAALEFSLIVTDARDLSSPAATVTITPTSGPPNEAPTADAGRDRPTPEMRRVHLDGSGSNDPDGDNDPLCNADRITTNQGVARCINILQNDIE